MFAAALYKWESCECTATPRLARGPRTTLKSAPSDRARVCSDTDPRLPTSTSSFSSSPVCHPLRLFHPPSNPFANWANASTRRPHNFTRGFRVIHEIPDYFRPAVRVRPCLLTLSLVSAVVQETRGSTAAQYSCGSVKSARASPQGCVPKPQWVE